MHKTQKADQHFKYEFKGCCSVYLPQTAFRDLVEILDKKGGKRTNSFNKYSARTNKYAHRRMHRAQKTGLHINSQSTHKRQRPEVHNIADKWAP
jgi:hypothetical protein